MSEATENETFSPTDPIVIRAFEICAEKGWSADDMFNWINAVRLARKEGAK